MAVRKASAAWKGTIKDGNGSISVGSGAFEGAYSFSTRFEEAPGTNPEELIAAAHAGCFSMALSGALTRAGFEPAVIETTAKVHLTKDDAGFNISKIELHTVADVPGLDEDAFTEHAEGAKAGCPVSKALAAVDIELHAHLKS